MRLQETGAMATVMALHAKATNIPMNAQSDHAMKEKRFSTRFGKMTALLSVVLAASFLAGCSRPGDENVQRLVEEAYECKHVEVVAFNKFDSMAGIYSYVAQYTFKVRFKDGEKGAQKYFNELFNEMEMKGDNWEAWLEQKKVQEYVGDECSEAGQVALERMSEVVMQQMYEKKTDIRMPLVMPMVGWAEYMPGRKGWDITVRRDRVSGDPELSEPVKRDVLLKKVVKKKQKAKTVPQ